jgi:hypothetical protein
MVCIGIALSCNHSPVGSDAVVVPVHPHCLANSAVHYAHKIPRGAKAPLYAEAAISQCCVM